MRTDLHNQSRMGCTLSATKDEPSKQKKKDHTEEQQHTPTRPKQQKECLCTAKQQADAVTKPPEEPKQQKEGACAKGIPEESLVSLVDIEVDLICIASPAEKTEDYTSACNSMVTIEAAKLHPLHRSLC